MYQPVPGAERLEVPEDVQEMFTWAANRGVRWPKLVYPVRFPPGYIGSMVVEEIHPNERIVIAPNRALFTSKVARESPDLQTVFENFPESFNNSMLALITFFVWEKSKGAGSDWAPFIKYQPKNPSNLQDWTSNELDELQDEDVANDVRQRKEHHEFEWKQWRGILSKFPQFTPEITSLEEYTWVLRLIETRSFEKFMPHVTLFPVGELFNHENVETFYIYQFDREKPDSSSRYSGIVDQIDHDDDLITRDTIIEPKTGLIFSISQQFHKDSKDIEKIQAVKQLCDEVDQRETEEAKERKNYRPPDMDLTEDDGKDASICAGPNEHYLPGSQVHMSYGRNSNRQLLSTYGFSLKVNHFNYARVKVLLQDLTLDQRLKIFLSDIQGFVIFKLKKDWIAEEFLRTIRGLHWNFEMNDKSFLDPVNIELEKKVLDTGIFVLTDYLKKFPTTLEEDLKLLQDDLELRRYFAVLFRSQVKEIIKNQINFMKIAKEIILRSETQPLGESLGQVESLESSSEVESNRRSLERYLSKLVS